MQFNGGENIINIHGGVYATVSKKTLKKLIRKELESMILKKYLAVDYLRNSNDSFKKSCCL